MAFVNFSVFALGGLMIGVPIVLHLLMRQKPRHQVFPALRFLQHRRATNQRRMRLRHWLLLALRVATIALLALLLSRPSVDSTSLVYWIRSGLLGLLLPLAIAGLAYAFIERRALWLRGLLGLSVVALLIGTLYNGGLAIASSADSQIGDAQAPVAAVVVFDTSPRMGLIQENRTRLDQARELAAGMIRQLPTDSEVAIIDALTPGATFQPSRGAAINLMQSLTVLAQEKPLHAMVARGIELAATRVDRRREVFVLTDLSQVAWQASDYAGVAALLQQHPEVSIFVLDVGVTEPSNIQLDQLRLSSESLAAGRSLHIESQINHLAFEGEVVAECLLERRDPTRPVIVDGRPLLPESQVRDRVTVNLSTGSASPIEFTLTGLTKGLHHGRIELRSSDGLSIDDTRYFTIEVRPTASLLLISSTGATPRYVEAVLAPDATTATFACELADPARLVKAPLEPFDVIAWLDPAPESALHWERLRDYAESGGRVALLLGRNAQPPKQPIERFNDLAGPLLPGRLALQWVSPPNDSMFVAPRDYSHPMLSVFRGLETVVPWDESPVVRHWAFDTLAGGANVIARFSNGQPAITEHRVGEGRVVTMTTPLSDARNDPQRPAWNELPTAEQPLPFYMLTLGMFDYLARSDDRTLNTEVGQDLFIPLPDEAATWQLFRPQGDWQNVGSTDGVVEVRQIDVPGAYRVRSVPPSNEPLGFCANLPTLATDVRRSSNEQVRQALGGEASNVTVSDGRIQIARDIQELGRRVGESRVGRELYPFLALVLAALLAMELLVSNFFYASKPSLAKPMQRPAAAG